MFRKVAQYLFDHGLLSARYREPLSRHYQVRYESFFGLFSGFSNVSSGLDAYLKKNGVSYRVNERTINGTNGPWLAFWSERDWAIYRDTMLSERFLVPKTLVSSLKDVLEELDIDYVDWEYERGYSSQFGKIIVHYFLVYSEKRMIELMLRLDFQKNDNTYGERKLVGMGNEQPEEHRRM